MNILEQLQERHVFRAVSSYAIVCFVVLQLLDVAGEPLGITMSATRTLIFAMIIGIPIVAYLSWVYDLKSGSESEGSKSRLSKGHAALLSATALAVFAASAWWIGQADSVTQPVVEQSAESTTDVYSSGTKTATTTSEAIAQPQGSVFAMLPFEMTDPNSEQLVLTEGLHAEILRQMSKLEGFTIISRSSVLPFAETSLSIADIAATLRATTVLTASARFFGQTVRLSFDLVEIASGQSLWAESYDRSVDNLFDIEREVSLRVVNALDLALTPELQGRVNRIGTVEPNAHRAYLQALSSWKNYHPTPPIRRLLEKAVSKDPQYADAWSYLAWVLMVEYSFGQFDGSVLNDAQRMEKFRLSEQTARKALELDPNQGLATQVLGYAMGYRRQWRDRLYLTERAVRLEPGDYRNHAAVGNFLLLVGQDAAALDHFEKAVALAPYDAASLANIANALYWGDHLDAAEPLAQRLRELSPSDNLLDLVALRRVVLAKDVQRFEELSQLYIQDGLLNPTLQIGVLSGAYALYGAERAEAHLQLLADKGVDYLDNQTFKVYAALVTGDAEFVLPIIRKDLMSDWSDFADDLSGPESSFLYANLMNHPEFQELVKLARTPRPNFGK